jgi:pyruvate kinase
VAKGTTIALDDGKILLAVSHVEDKDIVCNVVRGGLLLNEKGVNIIDTDIPINSFTKKDEEDALFALSEHFDALALSFVKNKNDVIYLRDFLKNHTDRTIPIISKIETKQALHEMSGILEVTDMIMVARGDLGIEIPIEKIPIVQKELLFVARGKGVPTIVATEMLTSMKKNPFPTRAEITDCIGALIDGASYIMLSDETTVGEYPVEAVTLMSSVINEFIENKKKYLVFEK